MTVVIYVKVSKMKSNAFHVWTRNVCMTMAACKRVLMQMSSAKSVTLLGMVRHLASNSDVNTYFTCTVLRRS